jgi:hypothetical protein
MDVQRFDAMTRACGSLPRRRLLGGLAGSALGAVAVTLGFAEAEATHFFCLHVGRPCKKARLCCSSRCKRGRCRAHNVGGCTAAKDICVTTLPGCGGGSCYCNLTTGGANFCSAAGGNAWIASRMPSVLRRSTPPGPPASRATTASATASTAPPPPACPPARHRGRSPQPQAWEMV